MAKLKDPALERNEEMTEMPSFMESYNKMLPVGFPRASIELLKQFKNLHPSFFKNGSDWSLVKHRKKVVDWLAASLASRNPSQ